MGGCSISSFHAILCVILPCLHDRSPLCDIFSYLFCSISCFPRFCIPQWVIFTWDCTQRNVQKLWRTLQHTAGMATMIISFFTASSKASWYRQEILWEMAPEGNLFGAGSLRMNFTRGLSFFFFWQAFSIGVQMSWAKPSFTLFRLSLVRNYPGLSSIRASNSSLSWLTVWLELTMWTTN